MPRPFLTRGISSFPDVLPLSGRRHTCNVPDDGLPVVILEIDAKQPVAAVIQSLEVVDEVVLLEETGHFDLELGERHVGPPVPRTPGIPGSG